MDRGQGSEGVAGAIVLPALSEEFTTRGTTTHAAGGLQGMMEQAPTHGSAEKGSRCPFCETWLTCEQPLADLHRFHEVLATAPARMAAQAREENSASSCWAHNWNGFAR